MLAFPALLLAILFAAVFRPGILTAMIPIGWLHARVARLVRAADSRSCQDYVTAARTFGSSRPGIFWRHCCERGERADREATWRSRSRSWPRRRCPILGLGTHAAPSWGRC